MNERTRLNLLLSRIENTLELNPRVPSLYLIYFNDPLSYTLSILFSYYVTRVRDTLISPMRLRTLSARGQHRKIIKDNESENEKDRVMLFVEADAVVSRYPTLIKESEKKRAPEDILAAYRLI